MPNREHPEMMAPVRCSTVGDQAFDGWKQCNEANGQQINHLAPLLVVLDLDHTLVCSRDQCSDGYDFCFARGNQEAFVWKRPGLDAFLARLDRPDVEVAAYTAASGAYMQSVLAGLDPQGSLFKRRLSRGDCVLEPPAKDLARLGHDLRRTVLVDDSMMSFRLQPDNGLPVAPYRHTDTGDKELQRVIGILEHLVGVPDVRTVLRERFAVMASVTAKLTQGNPCTMDSMQAPRVVCVSGAGLPAANGRYAPRRGPLKCGRPVYVHEERPLYRILWSERGGSWVIDDGEAKEYRYAAVGNRDMDVPLGALWSSCEDDSPQPLLGVQPAAGPTSGSYFADPHALCFGQAPFPAKGLAQQPALPGAALQSPMGLSAACGPWCAGAPPLPPNSSYGESGLGCAPWVSMAASAGA